MSKYIIKNCPAIFKHPVGHWNCQQCKECQDCTDCVLKQIVKKCKYWETYESCYDCAWGGTFGKEILELLDIEEVE